MKGDCVSIFQADFDSRYQGRMTRLRRVKIHTGGEWEKGTSQVYLSQPFSAEVYSKAIRREKSALFWILSVIGRDSKNKRGLTRVAQSINESNLPFRCFILPFSSGLKNALPASFPLLPNFVHDSRIYSCCSYFFRLLTPACHGSSFERRLKLYFETAFLRPS